MKRARSAWVVIPVAILLAAVIVMIGVLLVEPDNTAPDQSATQTTNLHDWLQFNANPQHSGTITTETILSPTNVSRLQPLYSVSLSGTVDGAPVYLANVKTATGTKNLVFATTTAGDILALDSTNGKPVWVQHNPAPNCFRNASQNPCYTTSSPAIDPNRQFVYSYGLDGYVHKYQVGDGIEVKGNGWPELTSAKLSEEKGSSALTIATTKSGDRYLYMTHAYYPDGTRRDQGHLTAINLATGSQHTFNTVCSDQVDQHFGAPGVSDCSVVEDGIWARGSVVYSPATDRIYFTAGCCSYDPAKHQWGQTVLALHPDGTGGPDGAPLDSYTQTDWQNLNEATQIASSAPAILPAPANSTVKVLGAQSGKDGVIRLLNLGDLSGQGGPGHLGGEIGSNIQLPDKAPLFTQLAVWVDPDKGTTWLYAATTKNLAAYQLELDSVNTPVLHLYWQIPIGSESSPIVAGNMIFYAHSKEIMALDPLTGQQLWHDTRLGDIHWQSPIAINGVLYMTDQQNKLTAYNIK